MRLRFMAAAVLAGIASLLGAASATAASLRQLPGRAGCVSASGGGACLRARALRRPTALAISPDGRDVYAGAAGGVVVLRRDRRSGALRETGCVTARGAGGCAAAPGLAVVNGIAVSRDGRNVYATVGPQPDVDDGGIVAFAREPLTGRLRAIGCVRAVATPGCTHVPQLRASLSIAIGPDGRAVYVGGADLVVFARIAGTGALAPATCVDPLPDALLCPGPALAGVDAAGGLAVSPDGRFVYAANLGGTVLSALPTPLTTVGGGACVASGRAAAGCIRARGRLDDPVMSRDGRFVYTSGATSGDGVAVTVLRRSAGGRLARAGCLGESIAPDRRCARGSAAFDDPRRIALSRDGRAAYTVNPDVGAVAALDRSRTTGALRASRSRAACVSDDGTAADRDAFPGRAAPRVCRDGRALRGASDVALSPDGRHAYVAATRSDAIAVFTVDR